MSKGLFIGVNDKSRKEVWLSNDVRSTHVHIIGASGEGKSKAMEHMIRKDILDRRGLCLIDPHGRLYGDVVRWLATKRINRKIIFFNPASDEWTVGFNPLKRTTKDIAYQRDAMVRACAKVWGADDLDRTPLLKRILRDVIHVLLEKRMSLRDAFYLIDSTNIEMRKYLVQNVSDPMVRQDWNGFNLMERKRFDEYFSSTVNRLHEFLSSDRVRRIFGQIQNVLDVRRIMDEGHILLVNLSSGESLSGESARVLGTLLVNDIFLNATERDERTAKRAPFYLYIDEFGLFVNDDIRRILDEGRKFGLHLILAHQHLGQIEEDSNIYKAVMQDARTKLIFGGMMPEDAEKLAQYALDPNAIKREITATKEHHKKIRDQSYTAGRADAIAEGKTWGASTGTSAGKAAGQTIHQGPDGAVIVEVDSNMQGTIDGSSRGGYVAKTETQSLSVSDIPGIEYEEYQEVTSVHEKSLEEQLYEAMSVMVTQPSRHCLLKVLKKRPIILEVPLLEGARDAYAGMGRVKGYEDEYLKECEFVKSVDDADEEIRASEKRVNEGFERWKAEEEGPKEPEDFYEQEADLEEPEEPREPEDFYE